MIPPADLKALHDAVALLRAAGGYRVQAPPPNSGWAARNAYIALGQEMAALEAVYDFAVPAPYFVGDFETGDLSQWPYLGDAHGVSVVRAPTFDAASRFAARALTTSAPDSSVGGDASYVEMGTFRLPWENPPADVWHRIQVLLPSGNDPRYPGVWRGYPFGSGGWNMFMEWHNEPGYGPGSSYFGSITNSDGSHNLFLRIWGGEHSAPQERRIVGPELVKDHWYTVLVRFRWSADPNVGWAEWWIDGVNYFGGPAATSWHDAKLGIGGVLFETGHYRGPSSSWTDTVYWDGVRVGPTRASVGG